MGTVTGLKGYGLEFHVQMSFEDLAAVEAIIILNLRMMTGCGRKMDIGTRRMRTEE